MLKRKVYCGIETCMLLCALRLTQGHDVLLSLKFYCPICREVGGYLTVNLDLRRDGLFSHVRQCYGGLGECRILLPIFLQEVELFNIGYQSSS